LRVEDWASFDFSYSLDLRRLIPHIIAIEEYKAAALSPVLPPHWLEAPDGPAPDGIGPATAATDKTDRAAPAAALADPPAASEDDPLAGEKRLPIHNTSTARAWVRQRFGPGSAPISVDDILTIHRLVAEQGGAKGRGAGILRTYPVQVGREEVGGIHQGAPPKQLPLLMDRYVAFIDGPELRSLPPTIHALLAHYFLDTLHPFLDGNGRTSRLVTAAILSQHGYNLHGTYALIRCFYRHEIRYHTILHRSWKRCPFEVTPFVAFGLEGFVLELKSVDSFIKMKLRRVVDPDIVAPAFRRRIGVGRGGLN
jgi:hypothetical protein